METWKFVALSSVGLSIFALLVIIWSMLYGLRSEVRSIGGRIDSIPKGQHRHGTKPREVAYRYGTRPRMGGYEGGGQEVDSAGDVPSWSRPYIGRQGHQGVSSGLGTRVA